MVNMFNERIKGGGISSISRDTSNIMKGALILLIVIGHNTVLTNNVSGLFDYLYSFHVLIFLFYHGSIR